MECGSIDALNLSDATEEQVTVSHRFFNNRAYLTEQLREKFLHEGYLTYENASNLNSFIEFLKYKVTIIRIQSPTFEGAYHIFEILNNRGLPLSNKDLFRNFLIKEFSALKSKFPDRYASLDPNQKWRKLEDDYEFRVDFINRYVESTLGKNQEFTAFNELTKEIYNRRYADSITEGKIELFYHDIQNSLEVFTNIIHLRFADKRLRNRIQFLMNSGNATYILNLLLALFRNVSDSELHLQFLLEFERYILFLLLNSRNRFRSSAIYTSIKLLNAGKYEDAKGVFSLDDSSKRDLMIGLANGIKENDIAKLVVARYFWALENQSPQDVIEQSLSFENATLEHIIPQNPSMDSSWRRDFGEEFRKDFCYRLGNFTLLTQKTNSAARNFDFDLKRQLYSLAKLAMTRELAADSVKMDEGFIVQRHDSMLQILSADLQMEREFAGMKEFLQN